LEVVGLLLNGMIHAFQPGNFIAIVCGSILGVLVGALPGIGPSAGAALLLPLTLTLTPTIALVLLCSLYVGCMFGGRITSILANIPGDDASIATCFDGYPMTLKGRAGPALGITAISSYIGGLMGLIIVIFTAKQVARFGLYFGPAEYFALMALALSATAILGGNNPAKGIAMTALGLLIAMVGLDFVSGKMRLTFGNIYLERGIDFLPVSVGMFALSELFKQLEEGIRLSFHKGRFGLKDVMPTREDVAVTTLPIARGGLLGFIIGVLPGAGGTIASFMTYAMEKRLSKRSEEFGTGVPEGVASVEAANNAAAFGAMVPLLTLGIPGSGTTAIMLGGLIMWGVRPGPLFITQQADLFWSLIGALFVANIVLLLLNTAFIPFFVRALKALSPYLEPLIAVLCMVGVFGLNNSIIDVWLMLGFGILGYLLKKCDYPVGPVILAVVLGPLAEGSFRQALMMSRGSMAIFVASPLAKALMMGALLIWCSILFRPLIARLKRSSTKVGAA
jgi:putative tricarboxylic transport membrane protein